MGSIDLEYDPCAPTNDTLISSTKSGNFAILRVGNVVADRQPPDGIGNFSKGNELSTCKNVKNTACLHGRGQIIGDTLTVASPGSEAGVTKDRKVFSLSLTSKT